LSVSKKNGLNGAKTFCKFVGVKTFALQRKQFG